MGLIRGGPKSAIACKLYWGGGGGGKGACSSGIFFC